MNRMPSTRAVAGWGWLPLALFAFLSCGGEQSQTDGPQFHDSGREILGDPQAVLATVSDEAITLAEVDLVVRYWMDQRSQDMGRADSQKAIQRRALDQIIDQVLLAQEAERRQIVVADSMVDQMTAAWEASFDSDEERQQRLESTNISPQLIRLSMRRDLLVRELVQRAIRDTVEIAEEAIREFYAGHQEFFDTTQVRASHILFNIDPAAEADSLGAVRGRAQAVLGEARSGGDFARLARLHSDCPSRENGGDLGIRRRSDWVKPFADAAFALEPGELSDLVQTRFGIHIILVQEKLHAGCYALDETRTWIRQRLTEEIVQVTADKLAQRLRAGAQVKIEI